jgi:hypothetical protein
MPRLTPTQAEAAVDKILALPPAERPARMVLAVAGSVSREAKRRALQRAHPLSVEFWDGTALEERVYRGGPSVLSRFFQIGTPSPSLPLTLYRNRRVSSERVQEIGEAAAVEIRRELAASRPDAFRPNLAGSLGNLAKIFKELGRTEDAFRVIDEALRTFAPHFLALPVAFQDLMGNMVSIYLETAEDAGREPDSKFLEPIQDALAMLQRPK